MATISRGYSFAATETVTAAKLHTLVDSAGISLIATADIANAAIVDAKINDVSGAKLTNLANTPSGAGILPVANTDVGTTANKIVQLTAAAKLPAVDGSLLTNLPSAEGTYTDYSGDSTIVGWASFTNKVIKYIKIGKLVYVYFYLTGTSNNATTTFTIPDAAENGFFLFLAYDNGSTFAVAQAQIIGSTVTCYKDIFGGAFAASNTKYAMGQFWYVAS